MRIVLVDDHSGVRSNIRQLLELQGDFEVVGEGENGHDAVERVESLRPDVVLMDMNMPGMSGTEATKVIKDKFPEVKVLALTAFADMTLVSEMVKAGASGYLLKGGSPQELLKSLEAVAHGHAALDKQVTKGVMDDMAELYEREQERADALAELDRMKSEFISVVSHELRTPLTSIKGGAQTLQAHWGSIDTDTTEQLLSSIVVQCERLNRMIGQIFTVSGIQKGGLGLSPSVFSLARVAAEAADDILERNPTRTIELDIAEVDASGDRQRIADVCRSLIDNAIKFTAGTVKVRTILDFAAPKLQVIDEGPGIDPGVLRILLEEPFHQVDSSNTRSVGGLGLSLYIAQQVLEASGGRLEIDTGPDHGSVFTMVLPGA